MVSNDEVESEDDIPLLAVRVQKSQAGMKIEDSVPQPKRNLGWHMKDLEDVNSVCDVKYSDPTADESLVLFKIFCNGSVIENFVQNSNLFKRQDLH